ncbi:hypothetical protein [Azospirillum halopraeferens]|uniref:hypothetical protein n=1 Tax=Azospirillum halopraeferens TaxID=34010 RepID=UPI0003FA894C|nr:hypothetical protein [Azospirillum halopraeferens]
MTDDRVHGRHGARPSLAPPPASRVVWLVSGLLAVTDRDLPAALHKLADHADDCLPGFPTANIGGIIMHGRLKLTWSIGVPREEVLPALLDEPDPKASYRLLTLTVTTFAD